MSLAIEKSPLFHADVTRQFGWYVDEAGEELRGEHRGERCKEERVLLGRGNRRDHQPHPQSPDDEVALLSANESIVALTATKQCTC